MSQKSPVTAAGNIAVAKVTCYAVSNVDQFLGRPPLLYHEKQNDDAGDVEDCLIKGFMSQEPSVLPNISHVGHLPLVLIYCRSMYCACVLLLSPPCRPRSSSWRLLSPREVTANMDLSYWLLLHQQRTMWSESRPERMQSDSASNRMPRQHSGRQHRLLSYRLGCSPTNLQSVHCKTESQYGTQFRARDLYILRSSPLRPAC
jgi:hypothetical protein